jgi:predicted acyltransferase
MVSANPLPAPAYHLDGREASPAAPTRLLSLDVFRGITIAAMILVNNAGNEDAAYWPLKHAAWNGWTPTDLIFPFFLFIVGVSLVYSTNARLRRGQSRTALWAHAVRRACVLFALGVFLNGFPNHYQLASLRIEGVLQRIAVCYLVAAALVLWTGTRVQVLVAATCLAGYWVLMRYVPVPGYGVPTHTIPLLDPDRNLAAWLDRRLLFRHLYEGTRDPEGVLSTIPAIATALIGVLTGKWLTSDRSGAAKFTGMLLAGVCGILSGEFFNLWFPINKKLWTSSYVLFTAGVALLFLALCYWISDLRRWRGWTMPALVFGLNAIAAYVLAEMIEHALYRLYLHPPARPPISWQAAIYGRFFAPLGSPPVASLIYSLGFVLVCWIAMWLLYRRRIFLKL